MNKTVTIVGAGGKMGARAVDKLRAAVEYTVLLCENDPDKAAAMEGIGQRVTSLDDAVPASDFIILAVPDESIGAISHSIVPCMKPGAALITLDASAAYIGEIPSRDSVTQMIAHPCHPPLFAEQDPRLGRRDFFGGIAQQDILVALIKGSEGVFQEGTEVAKLMFAPVRKAHRVTPEEFALLEPAMSEIVVATAATLMKASLETAVAHGVPREAAEAFMAGHAQIAMAIVFGAEPSPFSDAAKIAIRWGMEQVIKPDWKHVFEPESLHRAIQMMLHPDGQVQLHHS